MASLATFHEHLMIIEQRLNSMITTIGLIIADLLQTVGTTALSLILDQ